MTDLHPTYGGPYIQKSGKVSPHEAMKQIMDGHPKLPASKIDALFTDAMLNDPDLTVACIRAFAINCRGAIVRLRNPKKDDLQDDEINARAEEAVRKIRNAYFALAMKSTFGELAKLGPRFIRLSKMGKSNQRVADVMTTDAVRKILNSK